MDDSTSSSPKESSVKFFVPLGFGFSGNHFHGNFLGDARHDVVKRVHQHLNSFECDPVHRSIVVIRFYFPHPQQIKHRIAGHRPKDRMLPI